MRKTYQELVVLCLIIAGFALAGCASRGDLKKLQGRVGAAELAIETKANRDEVMRFATVVADNAKSTQGTFAEVAAKLAALDTAKADKAEVEKKLAALDAAKTEQEKRVAVLAEKSAAQEVAVAGLQGDLKKQAARNSKLTATLRDHRRGDKLEFVKHRVALGDKAPTGAVQCWGFASGKADLEELLKSSSDCKKQLDELKEQIAAGKVEILGAVGFEDRVKCKEPATDECKNVAWLRGEAVAEYLGADKTLVSTEPPTDEVGAMHRENRGVVVFFKKK